jgi:hypothetical protein
MGFGFALNSAQGQGYGSPELAVCVYKQKKVI